MRLLASHLLPRTRSAAVIFGFANHGLICFSVFAINA
jgi:hypothetical protein